MKLRVALLASAGLFVSASAVAQDANLIADVEFLQYKGLDHQLDDSGVRAELLTHIGELLQRTIGQ